MTTCDQISYTYVYYINLPLYSFSSRTVHVNLQYLYGLCLNASFVWSANEIVIDEGTEDEMTKKARKKQLLSSLLS